MDIYLIKIVNFENLDKKILKKFQKKKIANTKKLYIHCLSYFILDKILEEKYHIKNREILFENNKPILKNRIKYFSISHSKEYIAICFSDYNCGIDIEKISNNVNWIELSEIMKFYSKSQDDFYKNWTKYEAEYKLNCKCEALYYTQIDKYALTAVSDFKNEKFNIYDFNN